MFPFFSVELNIFFPFLPSFIFSPFPIYKRKHAQNTVRVIPNTFCKSPMAGNPCCKHPTNRGYSTKWIPARSSNFWLIIKCRKQRLQTPPTQLYSKYAYLMNDLCKKPSNFTIILEFNRFQSPYHTNKI